jgi:outer membrane biosynthesis protein TonB
MVSPISGEVAWIPRYDAPGGSGMRAIPGARYLLLVLASACGGGEASRPAPATPPIETAAAPAPLPPPNPDAAAVEAARPSLRACYDKARAANPNLGRTTVTLSLRVDPTGNVTTVDLEYKHRFDEASKGCMRDAAFTIKLPAGEPRRVDVPVTFEPR